MAFKTWQIGLHIQQHEALAIAVIRGASGWSLQRWWRLPLMNASTAEGTIPDPQSLAHVTATLEPRAAATSPYLSLFSRKSDIATRFSTSADASAGT